MFLGSSTGVLRISSIGGMSLSHREEIPVKRIVNALALAFILGAGTLQAQVDPGPRGGTAGAGSFFPTLTATEQAFFTAASKAQAAVDYVQSLQDSETRRAA